MCGIAGLVYFGKHGIPAQELRSVIKNMTVGLSHRGPDDLDIWCEDALSIALGHTRLAILDRSKAGAQPMESSSGRYRLVFNGEIYNHGALRKQLEQEFGSIVWKGHSDTETLLAAIELWGLFNALVKAHGMFALALVDVVDRKVSLARDRFGEKPLYYFSNSEKLVFGSEIQALESSIGKEIIIDHESVLCLLKRSYIAGPKTIYEKCRKVMPGEVLVFDQATSKAITQYFWDATSTIKKEFRKNECNSSSKALVDELDRLLESSVREQMISDVPLGAFLSGGVDSTAVVAMMQKISSGKVHTFSLGFHDSDFDEAQHAKKVAEYLGTKHHEIYVSPNDLVEVIEKLPQIYSEPFADSSQIPTYLISKFAKTEVSVALSGDGGDELFGGYNRYVYGSALWAKIQILPLPIRRVIISSVKAVNRGGWLGSETVLGKLAGLLCPAPQLAAKLDKVVSILGLDSEIEVFERLISSGDSLGPSIKLDDQIYDIFFALPELDFAGRMQAADTISYLPDDILCKVDRASMAESLEVRCPFLSQDLFEFAWRLPSNQKIRGKKGKWILRNMLCRYIPNELIDRPKQGFGIPIDSWLRGGLFDWAEDLLFGNAGRVDELIPRATLHCKWAEHQECSSNHGQALWNILMYEHWSRSRRNAE